MNIPNSHADLSDDVFSRRMAALGHPVRLELLRHLGVRDACCVKDMVSRVGLAQSTVSQHLKVLVLAGLVRYQTDRQMSRYSLDKTALSQLSSSMGEMLVNFCEGGPSLTASPDDIDHDSHETARCRKAGQ